MTVHTEAPRYVTATAEHVGIDPTTGELLWKNDDSDDAILRVKPEEIIFILRSSEGGYLIYTLSEDNVNDKETFKLLIISSPQELPATVLNKFLLDTDKLPDYLRSPYSLEVIISTGSGTGKSVGFYEGVLRGLLEAVGLVNDSNSREGSKGQYHVTTTTSPRTITDLAKTIALTRPTNKTIILLSGDGGVVDLLNGLDKAAAANTEEPPPPTVAILPLGTGNALFHSLHKPLYKPNTTPSAPSSPLVLSLRTLFRGATAPLPTFCVEFLPPGVLVPPVEAERGTCGDDNTHIDHLVGAIVASYGFHASLVYESDTPAYRVHGSKRFGMAAGELLKIAHGYKSVVEVRRRRGGGGLEKLPGAGGEFNYVLATMVSDLERGFTISPESRPLDGVLRLVSFGGMDGERTMGIMGGAYDGGKHVGMEGVGYEDVEEVRVGILESDERWRVVCVDGTIVRVEEGGVVRLRGEGGRERVRVVVDCGVDLGR